MDLIQELYDINKGVTTSNPLRDLLQGLTQAQEDTLQVFGSYLYYSYFGDLEPDLTPDYDFDLLECTKMVCALEELVQDEKILDELYTELLLDLKSTETTGQIQVNYSFSDTDDTIYTSSGDTYTVLPQDGIQNGVQEMQEAVKNTFLAKDMNKNRRKKYTLSKADLRRTAPARRRENLQNRSKRRRYDSQNKTRKARYMKMYYSAVKAKKHFKKIRLKA